MVVHFTQVQLQATGFSLKYRQLSCGERESVGDD
jgi:hypothetical protein